MSPMARQSASIVRAPMRLRWALSLAKGYLDRIEVGAIGRQEEEMRSLGADALASFLSLMACQIVEDHDVSLGQGRGQFILDVEREEFAVDRTIDDPRRGDSVVAQGRDEGHGLPVAEGNGRFQT